MLTDTWRNDRNIVLFVLNFILVIIGYGLAGMTGMATNAIVQPIKVIILAYSLYIILQSTYNPNKHQVFDSQIFVLLISLILISVLFSIDFFGTLNRAFQLLLPLIYLFLFDWYVRSHYSKKELLTGFTKLINITYGIPVVSFYLLGGSLSMGDIYGEVVGGFVSNHYGWASLLFILSYTDLYLNKNLNKKHKIIGLILVLPALYLLLISGNRASYLSFIIVIFIFFLRNSKVHIILKVLMLVISFLYVKDTLLDENSALSKRLLKTEKQMEDEEEYADTRATARKIGFRIMDAHPETYVTGLGIFGFREAALYYEPNLNFDLIKTGVHNSYLELLLGCGVIVFGIFFIFYILQPLWNYLIHYSSHYLFVLPLFIIPFFESNLGGGQFLFYPWFAAIFLLRK